MNLLVSFLLVILNANLYFKIKFPSFILKITIRQKLKCIILLHAFFLVQLFGFWQTFLLVILNLHFKPNMLKLHYKILTIFASYLLYLTASPGHLLYLIFFINLLILQPQLEENRLFLGEAFKLIGDSLKHTLVKMGIPPNGLTSFTGLGAGVICADQWSKGQRLDQITNNINMADEKIQDFKYRCPDYSKLSQTQKLELDTLRSELIEQRKLYQSTGGILYQEACNMHEKFIDRFS